MGSSKESGSTTINQNTTPTPTPEETRLNQLAIDRTEATNPQLIEAQKSGLNLINTLLLGQLPQGDLYKQIGGISPDVIGNEATRLALRALPGFQSLGLTDSGVAAREISRGISNELLFPAQQFNVGAGQNLLNLALRGSADVQTPILGSESSLGSRLAGLRSISSSGTQTSTTPGSNPFLPLAGAAGGAGLGLLIGGPTGAAYGGAIGGSLFK